MVFKNKIAIGVLTTALVGIASPVLADGLSDNHVVWDQLDQPVHSVSYENCVRTKWEAGMDPCAPPPEPIAEMPPPPPPAVIASPARMLKTEEKTVYFAFDRSELDDMAKARLDNLAHALKSSNDVRHAEIVGHADRIGTNDYNLKLSARRAEAVKTYLAEQGYINTRIAETRALGESEPVTTCEGKRATNALISCLQPDRRVSVEVKFMDEVASQ